MIVETQFMAVDISEVVSVSLGGSLKLIFKNGITESINYQTTGDMQADYKKLVEALKKRK
jgi:hypothetical protein